MKAPFSEYLNSIAPAMKQLVKLLRRDYEYVSVLSTDSKGFTVRISQHNKSVTGSTMTTEKGNVVRVYKKGLYSEYAFDDFNAEDIPALAEKIKGELNAQFQLIKDTGTKVFDTKKLADEPLELFVEMETGSLPEEVSMAKVVDTLTAVSDQGMEYSDLAIDCIVRGCSTHINKMFISTNRDLRQSYVYSEASIVGITSKDGENKLVHKGISGRKGPELFEGLMALTENVMKTSESLFKAKRVVPGEYEIITTPSITGLIAHEAFGHGVEMDMFVKNRALGKEYINKRVGSDLVTMHEGALIGENVTGFAFDDEGTLAGDVVEIDHGILKTGICDALSALRLGGEATGNGKRENFEHKVYTRMTNTVFDAGTDTVEDMIASVKYGYLLDGLESGMEDPKHWGIQCLVARGYEIKDGKLTGEIIAPVVMTGYVPDVLGSVTMASKDWEFDGCGGCGKGYKEWVKVSDGGPYLKTKARLG